MFIKCLVELEDFVKEVRIIVCISFAKLIRLQGNFVIYLSSFVVELGGH